MGIRSTESWLFVTCLLFAAGAAKPSISEVEAEFGPHYLHMRTTGDRAVCTFCHTPQGRQNGSPVWAPFWGAGEFQTFDVLQTGGEIDVRGNISVACLSCHDGSQAPDASASYQHPASSGNFPKVRQPGTKDHPVGIVYSGFGEENSRSDYETRRLQRDTIGATVRWWLDVEEVPDGIRDKTDVIFFTRGEGAFAQPFIECSSCHDPHASPGRMFLRATSRGSNLCASCHTL
jgi:predicted CXXCH cytochrome family protein